MNFGFHETDSVEKYQERLDSSKICKPSWISATITDNLTGRIPSSIGTLTKLEALDLSHNKLDGEVPPPVTEMSSLGRLNLSFNHLQGRLDKRYAHWPATSFIGNLNLCGGPLPN